MSNCYELNSWLATRVLVVAVGGGDTSASPMQSDASNIQRVFFFQFS